MTVQSLVDNQIISQPCMDFWGRLHQHGIYDQVVILNVRRTYVPMW